jgi:molybdopterin molybdotransferase
MNELLPLEDARAQVLAAIPTALPAEMVALSDSLGRVLAADVTAATDLPPWDNSAMDGYAIRAADVAGATEAAPVLLRVAGEVAAGSASETAVLPGLALRIATGAPMPPGADAVVAVEQTTPLAADGSAGPRGREATGPLPARIRVHEATLSGRSVRRRASDLQLGRTVLAAGRAIGPAELAIIAAGGVARVAVHARPRVAVLSTGDELRRAGRDLGAAGIPDSNGPALVALCAAAGAEARHLGIAPDRLEPTLALLRAAIVDADLVIVSGGVSVGPYDIVRGAFAQVGTVDLWRAAIQPGKPFAFGTAPRGGHAAAPRGGHAAAPRGGDRPGPPVLLFGLPGNPVSVFVTFEVFVRPALRRLAGRDQTALLRPVDAAVLEESVTKSIGRRAFLRVAALRDPATGAPIRDAAGRVRVALAGGQESHQLSALAAADGLAVVPESVTGLPAGAGVELWWLDRP